MLSDHLPIVVELLWENTRDTATDTTQEPTALPRRTLPAQSKRSDNLDTLDTVEDDSIELPPLLTACNEQRVCQWRSWLNTYENAYLLEKIHRYEKNRV